MRKSLLKLETFSALAYSISHIWDSNGLSAAMDSRPRPSHLHADSRHRYVSLLSPLSSLSKLSVYICPFLCLMPSVSLYAHHLHPNSHSPHPPPTHTRHLCHPAFSRAAFRQLPTSALLPQLRTVLHVPAAAAPARLLVQACWGQCMCSGS